MNNIHNLLGSHSSKKIFLVIIALMTIILIDTFLIKFYDLVDKNFIPILEKKIIFTAIVFGFISLEFIMINYVKKLIAKEKSNSKMDVKITSLLASLSYYALMILFSLLIFELYYFDYYDTLLIMIIISISFGVASIFIGKTVLLFISWFRFKHNFIFLLYFTSMSMILFNLVVTSIIVNASINDRPTQIREYAGGSINISAGKYDYLLSLFKISAVLSFGSFWLTTSLLMYSSKDKIIGKVQYWIILIIPLVYFVISYFAQYILSGIILPYLNSDPISVSLVLTSVFILSKPIGGIVFGVSFWRISKLVGFQKTLQGYVTIAGYGFLLLFSGNQAASLVLVPYPPFGITTISILIIASYLIYIGIYKSATMISSNAKIRKYIYEISSDSKLLNLSGRTEMEKEIESTVDKVIEIADTPTEESDFEMDEKELKNYVEKVIRELRKNN